MNFTLLVIVIDFRLSKKVFHLDLALSRERLGWDHAATLSLGDKTAAIC